LRGVSITIIETGILAVNHCSMPTFQQARKGLGIEMTRFEKLFNAAVVIFFIIVMYFAIKSYWMMHP
jgi:hypothetical protein